MGNELKPDVCPFCGRTPEIINSSVHCNNPFCEAQPFTAGQTVAEAIAAWNRRALSPSASDQDAERAAWLADKIVALGDYAKEAAEMLRRWPSASDPVGEPVAWMRHDGMKAMPADEKAAYEAQSDNLSKSIAAEYSIPLYASPLPLLAKCAQIAEWHLQDNDECGVLAREVYEAITKASASPLPQEPREAEQVCAEAYQVVGSLLSDLGKFDTPEAEKILDNLSQAKLVHKDVLPWPSYASGAQEVKAK